MGCDKGNNSVIKSSLETKDVIAHLGRSARLLESKIAQGCLCRLDHAWRPAQHDLGVGSGGWELLLHERLCGVSCSVCPICGGLLNYVIKSEVLGVSACKCLK